MMRIGIIGAGYSARAFARLAASGAEWVAGTSRAEQNFPLLRDAGIKPILFDGQEISAELNEALSQATHILVSAAPGDNGDPFLRLLPVDRLPLMPALRWIGYFSTVGVYGDHDGAWVDEQSECRARSKRGIARIKAEQEWLAAGRAASVPIAVLRLAGIYGPGRNPFAKLADGTARRVVKPGQVFNRIHVNDIAGATLHLAKAGIGGIFNVADGEPAPPQDVVTFAAALMGVESPPEIAFDDAEMSPMARSFYADNRRVSNAGLKQAGYRFQYSSYRKALAAMVDDDSWNETR